MGIWKGTNLKPQNYYYVEMPVGYVLKIENPFCSTHAVITGESRICTRVWQFH